MALRLFRIPTLCLKSEISFRSKTNLGVCPPNVFTRSAKRQILAPANGMYGGGDSQEEGLEQARIYDLATSTSRSFPEEAEFVQLVAQKFTNLPLTSALELAAGPARHSIELAKRGVEMVAMDTEESMVQLGLELANEEGLEIKYIQQDMRNFNSLPGGKKVEVAMLLFGSAGHLLTNDDFLSCLQSCREVLADDGVLILEFQHPYDTFSVTGELWGDAWEVSDPKSGNRILVEWGREGDEFSSVSQVVQKHVSFNVFSKQGELIKSLETVMPQRLYTCTEIDALVRSSRFTIEKLYGDMDINTELDEEGLRMVVILKPKL